MKITPKLFLVILSLIVLTKFILASGVDVGGGMGIDLVVTNEGEETNVTQNTTTQIIPQENTQTTTDSSRSKSSKNSENYYYTYQKSNEAVTTTAPTEVQNKSNERILLEPIQKEEKNEANTKGLLIVNIFLAVVFVFFIFKIVQRKSDNTHTN